jgi:hypothetical protein
MFELVGLVVERDVVISFLHYYSFPALDFWRDGISCFRLKKLVGGRIVGVGVARCMVRSRNVLLSCSIRR